MKSITATSFLLGLLYSSSIADAYVPYDYENMRRTTSSQCPKNNLYRALERLQRDSGFCGALLQGSPTVSIPSNLLATPIASFSAACTCILATAVPGSTTSTTRTTTSSTTTTSRTTTSSTTTTSRSTTTSSATNPGTCETKTVTETQAAVTVTVTKDATTVTETAQPSTCVANPPAGEPTVHTHGFEFKDAIFRGSIRTPDDEFSAYGPFRDSGLAHSGDWFYRVSMWREGRGFYIARFGTLQTVPIQANTDYTASVWTRQFDMDALDGVCTVQLYIDENNNNGIDSTGTAQGGFGITQRTINPSPGPWKKTEWTFNTRQFTTAVFAFFVECSCPNTGNCPTGPIGVGIDDLEIKPVST